MKIGWVSVSPLATTGYGRETREICGRLLDRWDILSMGHIADVIAWGGKQEVHLADGKKLLTLPMYSPLINRSSAVGTVRTYIQRYKLDLLIGHWDAFALEFLRDVGMPYIVYVPIDGPMTAKWYNYIKDAYRIVVYSKFGYNEMLRFAAPSRVSYIDHGCDTETFKPLDEDKGELRARIDAYPPIPEDCVLWLFVGANVGDRKKIPLLLRTFKKFGKGHLYLHTNPTAQFPRGYDLPLWVDMLGLKDRVHWPRFNPVIESVSDEMMCQIYNAADCLLHNSVAEGRGLPLLEALACGLPIIVGRNSACVELAQGHGWIAENVDEDSYVDVPVYVPQLTWYPVVDQKSLLEKMDEAYNHEDMRKQFGKDGREFALQYDWSKIMPKWYEFLDMVEEELEVLQGLV